MPFSISRKVFFTFFSLTLVTLFLGVTINLSLRRIVSNEERIGRLHDFTALLADIGHFHDEGDFHLSFHEDSPSFREALDQLHGLAVEISAWEEYRQLAAESPFRIAEQASYFRTAGIELLEEKYRNTVLGEESRLLFTEFIRALSSHGPLPGRQHEDLHQSALLMNISALNSLEKVTLDFLSQLKELRRSLQPSTEGESVLSFLDSLLLSSEKKYLSQLAIADRQKFLAETAGLFHGNAHKVQSRISLATSRQGRRIRLLVFFVVLSTALVTLFLWATATRRIRKFIGNFSYSIDSIERGEYRYDLPHIVHDELGEALLFAKKLSLSLEEKIAEQTETEKERERLQEQLYHAQKMESVGRLAGGIAHDFNNLLMGITGYSELALLQMESAHPCRGYLEGILESGEKAGALTAQLLTFSRKQILEKQSLDLNDIISEQAKMLGRMIGEDIVLDLALGEATGRVFGDTGQIAQILMNLAINAKDSMPGGGRLKIATSTATLDESFTRDHVGLEPGEYVQMTVTDTGEGMPRAVQERAFEPFFTTKEVGKGTGLGLATVFGIVKQHGGHVWLYSEEGEGTTIKVYFPVSNEEEPAAVEDRGEEGVPRGSETVLVVDDNADVRDVVGEALTSHGYTLLSANGGSDALGLLKNPEVEIDLLLTDVVMPGMNGRDLAKEAKAARPGIKIIFMSGHADQVLLPEDIAVRSDTELMQKPVMPTFLLKKVRNVLNGGQAQGGRQ